MNGAEVNNTVIVWSVQIMDTSLIRVVINN